MAGINLLPTTKKQTKTAKPQPLKSASAGSAGAKAAAAGLKMPKDLSQLPVFIIIFIALLFAGWLILTLQVKGKEKKIVVLDKKLAEVKSVSLEIDALRLKEKEVKENLAFFQKVIENNVLWSEKLLSINAAIPEQIWLTSIYTETKPRRLLVIKGSATSPVDAEIIDAISQFAGTLKKDTAINKDIEEIKLGNITSEKRGNFNIMNFTLFCKFKE